MKSTVTPEKIIELFRDKRNMIITHEQATEIIKFLRMLADTVVENYLREQRSLLQEQRDDNTSLNLTKDSMYTWDISKTPKAKQFSMCQKCTFEPFS